MMLFGIFSHLVWWEYIIVALILTQITIASVTLYLHRSQAHRCVKFHPALNHFFRFWIWLTTGMRTKEWVAVHRKHHAFVEQLEDPHSPQIYGIRTILFEGAELYKISARNKEITQKYGQGTPDDWIERHLYTPYHMAGIILMLVINLICFGLPGISIWGVQMLWIPLWAAGVVNGIGHYFGYRNFNVPDTSRNIFPWGIWIGGEELHNNHHTYPNSAKFSVKSWEIDLGWIYIKILAFLKLAKNPKTFPILQRPRFSSQIELNSVYGILQNRFQILSQYTHDVLFSLLYEERKQAGKLQQRIMQHAKKLLKWDLQWINPHQQNQLEILLEHLPKVKIAYNFRERLAEICQKYSINPAECLEALKEWCTQAEASGVRALQEFALKLKMGTVQ